VKLTTLAVSTAFILIVATLLNIGELYSMAGMLAALPLGCYFVGKRQNGGLSVERRLDDVAVPGRPLPVSLELKNNDPWPKRHLLIQDTLPRWLERDPHYARPLLSSLAPSATEPITYYLRPEKRGCYQVGPLEVTTSDPLGIFHFHQELPGTQELLVYPRTVDLPWVFPPGGSPFGTSSLHTAEMRGEGSEFFAIREYQPGDPLRRVHWRSSARMGRLAVIEYEHDVSVDLTLVLDARRGSEVGEGADTTLEMAVTAAASLAQMVLERGNSCRLVIPGVPVPRQGGGRGVDTLYEILEALARVNAEQTETAAEAVAMVLPEMERNATLTLVTAVWDEATGQAVTAAVDAGMAVMVVYVDPESFRVSASPAVVTIDRTRPSSTPSAALGEGPAKEGLTSTRRPFFNAQHAETVRTQILALRARPVILQRGADLADQFTLAISGRY
jgi:uncharacterized protein (DUF58 family)